MKIITVVLLAAVSLVANDLGSYVNTKLLWFGNSNGVCGKQRNRADVNATCYVAAWQQMTYKSAAIMEACVRNNEGNVNLMNIKIKKYKDALNNIKDCYDYSKKNKNHEELHKRAVKAYDIKEDIEEDVAKLSQQIQDCFTPAFDMHYQLYANAQQCKTK